MNIIKRNPELILAVIAMTIAFTAVFSLSGTMEQPVQFHSPYYKIFTELNGPSSSTDHPEDIENAYDLTYLTPQRFDSNVPISKDEPITIWGLRDGNVMYLMQYPSNYFTLSDANPAWYHAVKASAVKDTPDGPVMVFERDWEKMFVLFAGFSILIVGIVLIAAAVISQGKDDEPETKPT